MKLWLSTAEYGKHAGLSPRYIRDLVKNGKIVKNAHRKKDSNIQIHWKRADRSIAQRVHAFHPGAAPRTLTPKPVAAKTGEIPPATGVDQPPRHPAGDTKKLSFTEAQTVKAQYDAKLKELEYGEKSKALVKVSAVDAEFFNVARLVRDAILNVPGRVSAELAGLTDQHMIEIRITGELTKALEELIRA